MVPQGLRSSFRGQRKGLRCCTQACRADNADFFDASLSYRKLVPAQETQRVSLTPKRTFLTSTSGSHVSILNLTKKALAVLSVFGSSERHSGALNRSSFNTAAASGVIKREVWLNWFCKRPHERLWQNLGVPLPSQSLASCLSHSSCWCASTS